MELLQTAGNGHVRAVAADGIRHEGGTDSIPYLVEAFRKESNGKTQWGIAHALAASGKDGADEFFRYEETAVPFVW